MQKLNRNTAAVAAPYPEKVLQFGGGNFLRAFADWILDEYNEQTGADLGVLVVSPISRDKYKNWQKQDGLYHVLTRGYKGGKTVDEKHLVKSISRIIHLSPKWEAFLASAENPDMRFVISNTTEAGIRFTTEDKKTDTPPKEFPAKLTLWLHRRYQYFKGSADKGCIFIPMELILENGTNLRKCILQNAENWGLEAEFMQWVEQDNIFCNTLVDRIVPGISREALPEEQQQIGFEDTMMTEGEAFHFWAIEGPKAVQQELPLHKAGLGVIFTDDLGPYRTRKVRILNGAHTSMVPVGYLYGIETVREAVEHEVMGQFVRKAMFEEIIPTLNLPEAELQQYASDILDRFKNPFIKHHLISISLNSVSKFKTRVLPSILEYQSRKGTLPDALVYSLAALIHFYKGERNGAAIPLKDDVQAIAFLQEAWSKCDRSAAGMAALATELLSWEYAWETNLSTITGFPKKLAAYLLAIEEKGVAGSIQDVL